MYELYNGSARLTNALSEVVTETAAINRLAQILNYIPEQLKQDIEALNDRLNNEKKVRNALGEDAWKKLLDE